VDVIDVLPRFGYQRWAERATGDDLAAGGQLERDRVGVQQRSLARPVEVFVGLSDGQPGAFRAAGRWPGRGGRRRTGWPAMQQMCKPAPPDCAAICPGFLVEYPMPAPVRRRTAVRWIRRIAAVLPLALLMSVPPPSTSRGVGWTPWDLLADLFTPAAAAAPAPRTPQQWSGTAAGQPHSVSSGATGPTGAGHPATPDVRTRPASTPATTPALDDGREHFDPARSVRLPAAASATSDVYRNPDGTFTRKVFEQPVNYRAADGTWQPIDRSLTRGSDGRWRSRGSGARVDLAPRSGNGALLSWAGELAYSLAGAADVAGVVSGDEITYPDVLPGTDLTVGLTSSGWKESIVLATRPSVSEWTFPLDLHGLTPSMTAAGAVELRDASGTVQVVVPKGRMSDSAFDPRSGGFATSGAVTYSLVTVDGKPALKVSADPAWLGDKARVYPVTVDPSGETFGDTGDTYVDDEEAWDHSGDNELIAGTWNGGGERAITDMHFTGFQSTYAGTTMSSVKLHIFDSWAWTCTPEPFNVNPITQTWVNGGMPLYPGPTYGASIGSVTANPGAACTNTKGDRNVGTWMTVPLSTATFQGWINGTTPNNGLAVTASLTDSTQWKRFTSRNGPAGKAPYLEVSYTAANLAPQVTGYNPPYGYHVTTITPELQVRATDPEGSALSYRFQVLDDGDKLVIDSGTITSPSWKVPATANLKWGQDYTWTGQAYDGGKWSTVYQYAFSTPPPQPPVTAYLAQNGGRGFSPAVGNYTTSDVDASVPTVGPALAVTRSYNSLDPRLTGAFGAGWSSLADMKATEVKDTAGVLQTVVVTYPDGQDVAYGHNSDATFTPPAGRFASFTAVTGGYRLIDKLDVTYTMTSVTGSAGVYGLTSVTDAGGRAETLTWSGGHPAAVTAASGRTLTLAWSTPVGASAPHVATVTTDPVTAGQPATALTWTYTYAGDKLSTVCPPGTTTECTRYSYGATTTRYPSAVLNSGPRSYWRLGETSGPSAGSEMLFNQGKDVATYANVTLGQAGPLAGSTAKAAGFNGTSSSVALPDSMVSTAGYQSISVWFKTTTAGGLLVSELSQALGGGTPAHYGVPLYVGTDGKLKAGWWVGSFSAMSSTGTVTDGAWHHAVLTGAATSSTLYLDGVQQATEAGTISHTGITRMYLGAGWSVGAYPASPTGGWKYFAGSMAEAALYDRPLLATEVGALYQAGTTAAAPVVAVTRPSGKSAAQVSYDPVTGRVTQVTDGNGGTWQLGAPVLSGSSQLYAGVVVGDGPADYWRMTDPTGPTAVNEVYGGTATYSSVTLGGTGTGPFADTTASSFNGTSSYVRLPDSLASPSGPMSVEAWFRTSHPTGMLFAYQDMVMGQTAGTVTDALYVGNDGKLHGGFRGIGGPVQMTGGPTVTDNVWHHAVLTGSIGIQVLYLDGDAVDSYNGTVIGTPASQLYTYVGAGRVGTNWPGLPNNSNAYFNGQIGEVAFYNAALSSADVDAHWAAQAKVGGAPAKTLAVTDPGGHPSATTYDLSTGQLTASTDARGGTTRYGYDPKTGFLASTTDPNGNTVTQAHDVRGNVTASTDCLASGDCHTSYSTYFPDPSTKVLTPDPRNDVLLSTLDGRSASPTDGTYATTYTWDAAGNETAVTTPPVAGWPAGRVTAITYTDGTAAFPAVDNGNAPANLPATRTTPGGGTTRYEYFHNGDLARVTDPAGQVTAYTYDNLGRRLSTKITSNTYPAGLATSYTYDGHGNPLTVTAPAAADRVTGVVHTARTTIAYDADDLPLSTTVSDLTGGDASRATARTYDAHDLVATSTDAAGKVTTYGYDAYGRRTKAVDPLLRETDYAHDATGNPVTTTLKGWTGDPTNPSPPTDLVLESRAYDPAGRLASVTDAMGYVTAYTYTANGHTKTVTRKDPAHGLSFVEESDTYDGAGNLIRQVTNDGVTTRTVTVDAADRTTGQAIDPAGVNRTTAWGYDGDDRPASTTVADGSGTSTTYTTYDAAGRVLAVATPTTATAPTAWWKLTETSGTLAHDSAGDATATATNVTWSGGQAVFNGTSTQLTAQPAVLDTGASFTVSARATLTDKTVDRPVVVKSGALSLQYEKSTDRWLCQVANRPTAPVTWYAVRSTASPAAGVAATLTCAYDAVAGSLKLYVNGTAQNTATGVHTFADPADALWIGRSATAWFAGSVRDVELYPRALSATEVTTVNAGTAPAAGDETVRTSYTRDTRGAVVAVTDPDGNVTDITNDEAGRAVVTTAPSVPVEVGGGTPTVQRPVTTAGYDTFGEVVEAKDANGNLTTSGFDPAGRVTSVTRPAYTPPGAGTAIESTGTITYDAAGRVTRSTDGLQRPVDYTYTQLDDLATTTAPNTAVSHFTYDTNHEKLSATGPTGAVTQATWDYLGRQSTGTTIVRQPGTQAYTDTFSYGTGGLLTGTVSAGGVHVTYGYDALGQPTSRTNGGGITTTFGYDYAGRQVATVYNDAKQSTVGYDRAGRAVTTGRWLNATNELQSTTATYDPTGNQTAVTSGQGYTTTFTYDALGRPASQVEPVAAGSTITTSFGYDAAGHQTRVTDGRANKTVTTYNVWGLPESQILPYTPAYSTPATSSTTTSYDAAGQPVTQALPGGVTVTNTYDALGHVTGQNGTGAEAATAARTFGYDLAGRLTSFSAPGGTDTASLDDRGDALTVTGPSGTSSFAWNPDGKMAARTDAAGTTSYTYDSSGFLATDTDASTGTSATYTYNGRDQIQKIAYGTGDSRNFVYDGQRRLQTDTLKTSAGATVASIAYTYDQDNNPLTKVTTGLAGPASNTYTYDQADRLTSWNDGTTTVTYGYDAASNRTSIGAATFTYDARDQLVTGGGTAYTYTARGTKATAVTGSGTVTYTDDAFGQMVTEGSTTYAYDALGRPVIGGLQYSGADKTPVTDGTTTYSLDPAGAPVAAKSAGTGVLAWTDQHTDVVAQFLPTGSAVRGSTSYNPMGAVTATSGMVGALGYQSGYTDVAGGRVNMGARWYDFTTGQFDNRDTVTVSGVPNSAGANPFAYGNANPLRNIDPTGHMIKEPAGGGPVPTPPPNPPHPDYHGGSGSGGGTKPPNPSDTCYNGNQSASCPGWTKTPSHTDPPTPPHPDYHGGAGSGGGTTPPNPSDTCYDGNQSASCGSWTRAPSNTDPQDIPGSCYNGDLSASCNGWTSTPSGNGEQDQADSGTVYAPDGSALIIESSDGVYTINGVEVGSGIDPFDLAIRLASSDSWSRETLCEAYWGQTRTTCERMFGEPQTKPASETLGVCLTEITVIHGALGGLEVCAVLHIDANNHKEGAFTGSTSLGVTSALPTVGPSLQYSDARQLKDLCGEFKFVSLSASVTDGAGLDGTAFWGRGADEKPVHGINIGVSTGVSGAAPVTGAAGWSNTVVVMNMNGDNVCPAPSG
jgi:RHS repeat-associated protein